MTSNAWVVAMILNVFMGGETRAFSDSGLLSNTAHVTFTNVTFSPFIPDEAITVSFECTTDSCHCTNSNLIIARTPVTIVLVELISAGEVPWKCVGGVGVATLSDLEIAVVQ